MDSPSGSHQRPLNLLSSIEVVEFVAIFRAHHLPAFPTLIAASCQPEAVANSSEQPHSGLKDSLSLHTPPIISCPNSHHPPCSRWFNPRQTPGGVGRVGDLGRPRKGEPTGKLYCQTSRRLALQHR